MNDFNNELNRRLAALREQGLHRELRRVDSPQSTHIEILGRQFLNFSSNDYLGLANEPSIKAAAARAAEKYGAGAGASRLISGSLAPHHELEETLAAFKGTEAALGFSSGYAAATGAICALAGPGDVIVIDKRVHACVVDAARLCGATLRVCAHNDLNDLEKILSWAVEKQGKDNASGGRPQRLIVTESVFSMDGDLAPLRDLVALKEKYGAWLMVDEAHATGLHGRRRRGLAEACGVEEQVEIQMGTLGKAAGSAGGYICGKRALIEYLVNRARSFIFSTGPVPAAAAAATAGIRFIQSPAGEDRCRALWQRVSELSAALGALGPRLSPPGSDRSPIVPLIAGEETRAVEWAAALREQGIFVPAIRYPTVARGRARLRVTLTAAHTAGDVSRLAGTIQGCGFANGRLPDRP